MQYFGFDRPSFGIKTFGFGSSEFSPLELFAGGKQGVWYDPSDKSTLFQDVAGTVPVTKDGDPVALMRDKSGNNNHATQTVSTARPVYKTDGILHWLTFDGVDDWFDILSMDFLGGNIVSSASIRPMETVANNKVLLSQYGSRKSLVWYFTTVSILLYTVRDEVHQLESIPNGEDLVVGARNTQAGDYKGCRVDGKPLAASKSFDATTSSAPATAMLGSAEGFTQRFGGRLYGIVAAFNDGAVARIGAMDLYMANKAGVTL
jgi:hypothetical protein